MAECTIYDKLRYIAETKDLIKAAIQAQDVEVLESATFRQYAEYITEIRKVSSVNGMQGDVTITAEDLGALTAIPSEYITETELNEKGYLTAVPDVYITEDELSSQLADKVSQSGLNEAIEGVRNDIPTNVSELTNDSGYITLDEVPKQDLSGYALKSDIPDISVKQDKLTAGNGISITDNVISLDYEFDLFEVVQTLPTDNISDNKVYLVLDSNGNEENTYLEYLYVDGKWEELGKFKVNVDLSGYATEQWVNEQGFLKEHQDISNLATKEELNTKQDTISDLETIRSGAAKGATALQSVPDTYALKSEIPDITTKQDKLVSGTNIKSINGTSLLGSGNIVIEASSDNVPTLQTTVKGTTNNYVYSTGTSDKNCVISDIRQSISYSEDRVTIRSDRYCWGSTSSNFYSDVTIGSATTSKAGFMSASDKTKLDGIDLSTKQDTLVSGTNIKTINGTSLLGSGDITIEGGSGNVDLSDYYTKTETNALVNPKISQVTLTQAAYDALETKEDNVLYVISDAEDFKFKTINGEQIIGEGNIEVAANVDLSDYATKEELNAKQDTITDLETIRSGASKGATALQSVPDTYALKTDIPDITTKQDKLVSGTNIKTVNGNSLLGSGNIEVAKEWIGTQAEYDALETKDNNTTYYITE